MPQPIPEECARQRGIFTKHEQMENGEFRFRLIAGDGSSYIRCETGPAPIWENSHSHSALQELVLVQSGCVIYVEYHSGKAVFRRLGPGEFVITVPGIPHNELVGADTAVHTVKFGDCSNPDWLPCPELDALTKNLSWEQAQLLTFPARKES